MKTIITLIPQEVADFLAEHFRKQGYCVTGVDFDVDLVSHQRDEYDGSVWAVAKHRLVRVRLECEGEREVTE